jgi:ATP-dependent Lon protease
VPKSIVTVDHNGEKLEIPFSLPLLPLRDLVIFPNMVVPLLLGRQFSIDALQEAMVGEKLIFLCTQKNANIEEPEQTDLYSIGMVARVLQVMKLPNQMVKVLVEGVTRARLADMFLDENCYTANLDFPPMPKGARKNDLEALSRQVSRNFEDYVRLSHRIPDEVILYLSQVEDNMKLADTISAHLEVKLKVRQSVLEAESVFDQLSLLDKILKNEIEILKIQDQIDNHVKESLLKSQREYYLQHQLKAIKEELGQFEDGSADIQKYINRLRKIKAPKYVKKKANEEMERLQKMHPFSAEASVIRGYLDWLVGLPWGIYTKDNDNFEEVSKILDEDHYGLRKPKKRILEHLAVIRLAGKVRGPILCLVGPPGVGKTSIGKSVARALNRRFVRMSLGGMKDEAEIRGHRRTYIGSLPGRIIQSIKKAGSANPVFMLDEIDKVGADYKGDPAAALLEALDPEQNVSFSDNFLEVDFDLSQVLFLTTANTLMGIPPPLIDRMEVIRLPGYLDYEKMNIARDYLIPRLKKEMGLAKYKITLDDEVLLRIIHDHTREAGVRELERKIATIFRKIAEQIMLNSRKKSFKITISHLKEYLGPPKFLEMERLTHDIVGRAYGLAWTETGGEILPVEVSLMPGKGNLSLTGKLGDVMKESASAALSFIRSNSARFGLEKNFYDSNDIHVHIPEGAVPKDGPSAGITLLVAMLSAFIDKPVPSDIALTGELTLTGQILPVGGLNEKFIAAKRAMIRKIICPLKNKAEIEDLPKEITDGMELKLVKDAEQVLSQVFPRKKSNVRNKKR